MPPAVTTPVSCHAFYQLNLILILVLVTVLQWVAPVCRMGWPSRFIYAIIWIRNGKWTL